MLRLHKIDYQGSHSHRKIMEFEVCIPGLGKSWKLEKLEVVMEFQLMVEK